MGTSTIIQWLLSIAFVCLPGRVFFHAFLGGVDPVIPHVRGLVFTALWTLVVSCCLACSLPISSWWSGATPCSAVPECVEKAKGTYRNLWKFQKGEVDLWWCPSWSAQLVLEFDTCFWMYLDVWSIYIKNQWDLQTIVNQLVVGGVNIVVLWVAMVFDLNFVAMVRSSNLQRWRHNDPAIGRCPMHTLRAIMRSWQWALALYCYEKGLCCWCLWQISSWRIRLRRKGLSHIASNSRTSWHSICCVSLLRKFCLWIRE